MKEGLNSTNWKLITVLAILLILTFSLGFWLIRHNLNQNQLITLPQRYNQKSQTITSFPTNTFFPTKAEEKSNNRTEYINQACQYQLAYPKSWYFYNQAEKEETNTILIASEQVKNENISSNEVRIQIGCVNIDPNMEHKTIINNLNTRYQAPAVRISELKPTLLNNKTAYYQTISSSEINPIKEYFIFPDKNQLIIINIIPANSKKLKMAENIIKSISF